MPQYTIDPVIAAAKIVTELQTIVSRETDPLDSAVVSVTAVHGGQASNVIPEVVEMKGTLRSLTMDGLQVLQQRVREIVTHVGTANRCEATVEFPGHDYPPTVNDGQLWNKTREIAGQLLGNDNVHEVPPVMGGEDFAYYTERVPGCFVGLGVRNEEQGATYMVHHPMFKADEDALPIGTALHVNFALESLEELAVS